MREVALRRLLCPSDFSECARQALTLSLALAERHAGELRVVHVAPRRLLPLPFRGSSPLVLEPDEEIELAELWRFAAPARARGLLVSTGVLAGRVADAILDEAVAWEADLVVMGTRGLARGGGWSMGSATEEVLRRAPCPVLVVPDSRESQVPWEPRLGRILCPYDFSGPAQRSLEYALALARAWGSRLTLLHVLEWFPRESGADEAHLNAPEYHMDFSEMARERLRRAVPEAAREWCPREETVAVGQPPREILRVAAERGADLIALGLHGRRAIDRSVFGSTVSHVLRQAACPVLAIRPD